ncbi:cytochrome c and c1 heme-lyase [Lanmaoa asiatica]|nr:cytochrome c and c1 heme-lyase [Lanmaoa asiatica]
MVVIEPSPASQCPVHSSTQPPMSQPPARCPVSNAPIDPRNNMPVESQEPAPRQSSNLQTTRVISSIPRPPDSTYGHQTNTQEKWEYPSPQQFYNALLRKGWNMPEGRIKPMVLIHNKLNEDAWREVLRWESRFHGGYEHICLGILGVHILHQRCRSGQARARVVFRYSWPLLEQGSLPDPFDRHDWIVRRARTGNKARYVIDYYGIKHPGRETKLVIDARPALDSFDNARMRVVALISRILSILGAATTRVPYAVIKYGMCLLAIGVSVYFASV